MKILTDTFKPNLKYDLNQLGDLSKIVFFDIETTGLTPRSCYIYIIGCIFYKDHSFRYIQWFLEDYNEEKDLLKAFSNFLSNYELIIHYNGTAFDMPFILHRCKRYALPFHFENYKILDLYKIAAPLKHILKLPNCKQKTVELFIGLNRQDPFHGGELIPVFMEYLSTKDQRAFKILTLHNLEDLKGMLDICSILAYHDIFNGSITISQCNIDTSLDYEGHTTNQLITKIKLNNSVPVDITYIHNNISLAIKNDSAYIISSSYDYYYKNYYTNYKDYYYLPEEDTAIHKSLAAYVDKNHRIKATRDTCYTKFQVTEAFLQNTSASTAYINNILSYLLILRK